MSEAPRLVELEERLCEDADGSVKARLLEELRALQPGFKAALARGGTQGEFARLAAAERALAAAIEVLEKLELAQPPRAEAGPADKLHGRI